MRKRLFFLAIVGLLLAGCGQKGPLYMPQPAPDNQPSEPQS
ncbi:LPS translocon maturation chaperone LptM [Gallaecimonas xiamenensis]|nr:lipoprotein [Gallaecimonas xiamenensis]